MPPAVAQGATFVFNGSRGAFSGGVTRVTVDSPAAEIVDATGMYDPSEYIIMVPTGGWKGGSVSVEFISQSNTDVATLVRGYGSLMLSAGSFSVSRNVILESASITAQVGDVIRGSLKFVITDYASS